MIDSKLRTFTYHQVKTLTLNNTRSYYDPSRRALRKTFNFFNINYRLLLFSLTDYTTPRITLTVKHFDSITDPTPDVPLKTYVCSNMV